MLAGERRTVRRGAMAPALLLAVASSCSGGGEVDSGIPPFDVQDVIVRRDGAPPRDAGAMDTGSELDAGDAGNEAAVDVSVDDVVDAPADIVVVDPMAHVRLGNLLAPSGSTPPPSVDVCIRSTMDPSMTFVGPVFAGGGLTAGIGWNQISAYQALPPGMYDVAVVAAGSTDCNSPIVPVISAVDAGAAGQYSSVIFYGKPSVPPDGGTDAFAFHASILQDHDPDAAAAEPRPRLRLFHAQPVSLALDVGLSPDQTTFQAIFQNVSFGQLGMPAQGLETMFDPQGYFGSDIADAAAPVGARIACPSTNPMCTNPALLRIWVYIPSHSYITSFVASVSSGGTVGLGSVVCIDSNAPVAGLSDCRVCTAAANNDDAHACR